MPKAPVWCVVRIQTYRIQFVHADGTFGDLGEDLWVTNDREEAYNRARELRGLIADARQLGSCAGAEQVLRLVESLGS